MDKIKVGTLLVTTLLASNAFAVMKDVPPMVMAQPPLHALFATAEGAYTWDSIGTTSINGLTAGKTVNRWGGRMAAGATHYLPYDPNLSFTGEMGWGYYSKTNFSLASRGVDAQNQIYGVDFLMGGDYRIEQFDLFLKLGGMIENVRMNRNTSLQQFIGGTVVTGTSKTVTTASYVVPEIKVGGIYNFNSDWGLSLAYTYVFGNTNVATTVNKTYTPGAISSNTSETGGPIALSSITLGLRYSFA